MNDIGNNMQLDKILPFEINKIRPMKLCKTHAIHFFLQKCLKSCNLTMEYTDTQS